ncbi:ethylene-responsive nuclear protein / ethylene-regulated nuclear protein (ERT2) [Thalictrum thalictroides]|uniref:Ethylene-responsive nuclear protein / ethylene-regulated nuclear protein (ERT2) n=1 Tax=Thalictrum thalictroides TaxID=46969 RepID=A0A7J6VZM9_THATH|nr:ethylene-responsive nuclear protein / ethylene-regulated nuclear protein (ERT2) [Thalictrum thalictroides]
MWKKKSSPKITRVSRFVNSIRESSNKRGESLVVQTGFPTSLIDLIVKNRDCLNKSSSKKIKTRFSKELYSKEEEEIDKSIPNHPSTPLAPFILNSINELVGETEIDCEDEKMDDCDSGKETCVLNNFDQFSYKKQENEDVSVGVPIRNRVFVIVIKIFVMLILALGTKKLAVAITLSAFLLLFVEFLLKSCINEDKKSLVTDVVDLREEFQKMIEDRQIKKGNDVDSNKDDKLRQFSDSDQEKKNLKDVESVADDAKVENPRRTNSAKLRAKRFQKFMAKKFGGDLKNRRVKKEGKLNPSNVPSNGSLEEVKVSLGEIEEEQKKDEDGDDDDGQVAEEEVTEEYDSTDVSEVSSDKGFRDTLETSTNWSWRNLIPAVIILVGLVGGRTMALVLTVVWLLLLGVTQRLAQGSKKQI